MISTGATFKLTTANLPDSKLQVPVIAAFTPHKEGRFGVTIAEYQLR